MYSMSIEQITIKRLSAGRPVNAMKQYLILLSRFSIILIVILLRNRFFAGIVINREQTARYVYELGL